MVTQGELKAGNTACRAALVELGVSSWVTDENMSRVVYGVLKAASDYREDHATSAVKP